MIITFQEFWKDFDRKARPLNTSVVSASEDEKAVHRSVYFDGLADETGVCRIYARYFSPISGAKSAVIVMPDAGTDIEESTGIDEGRFIENGWSVLRVDYAGEKSGAQHFTVYPPSLTFANYHANPLCVYELPSSNSRSCRYIWATVILRSITFLESEGFTQIALLGLDEGGSQVIKALALEPSLLCGAVLNSQSRVTEKDESEYDSALVAYAAALGDKSYCPFVKPPLYFVIASNEQVSTLDNMNKLYMSCTDSAAYLSIAPRSTHALTKAQYGSLFRFFETVRDGATLIKPPKITAKNSEKNLYIIMNAAEPEDNPITAANLYISYSQKKSAHRNWHNVPIEKTGAGEYLSKITVFSPSDPVYAFFNVTYANGESFSANVLTVRPALLGVVPSVINPGRLLFSADNGVGEWTAVDENPDFSLFIDKGPFDIEGVYSDKTIETFAVSDALFALPADTSLQLTVHSLTAQFLTFSIKTENGAVYSAKKFLDPNENWLKIMFSLSDFHSADGILNDWNEAVKLIVSPDDGAFLINTMLWI